MRFKIMTMSKSSAVTAVLSQADFREGIARLGRAMNIVTTDGPAGRAGFTAAAVCIVTESPPTLLVCLNRSTSPYKAFVTNNALCVNTLRPVHEHISRVFDGKLPMGDRFATATWTKKASGAPMLDGAAVAFDCRVVTISDIGSHSVLVCEVIGIERHEMASSLIYFDRGYHRIFGIRKMSRDARIPNSTSLSSDSRRWTVADIERLRELAAANISKPDIASVLDRTSYAVEEQARKHDIKLKRVKRSDYSAKELR
jgi:flavin reductase